VLVGVVLVEVLAGVGLRYLACGIVAQMRPLLERISEQIDRELNEKI
jgi:hypothetical protein